MATPLPDFSYLNLKVSMAIFSINLTVPLHKIKRIWHKAVFTAQIPFDNASIGNQTTIEQSPQKQQKGYRCTCVYTGPHIIP